MSELVYGIEPMKIVYIVHCFATRGHSKYHLIKNSKGSTVVYAG